MKKQIYIPAIILMCAIATILFLKPVDRQREMVTIQTEVYPIRVPEMKTITSPGHTRTLWVQAKDKKTKNISFYADAATLDALIAKLRATAKNYPKDKNGKQVKFSWLVEKTGTSTFLKLVYPFKSNTTAPATNRC